VIPVTYQNGRKNYRTIITDPAAGNSDGELKMRAIGYSAAAAILILIGRATWTIPTSHAFTPSVGVDPFGMMTTATALPVAHYDDYSLVFN
jgi:hypothetical protein